MASRMHWKRKFQVEVTIIDLNATERKNKFKTKVITEELYFVDNLGKCSRMLYPDIKKEFKSKEK